MSLQPRERLSGYRAPNVRQRTNWRCNGKIRETLAAGKSVRILVFNPISHLRYGEFELNIAAGLEDSLIEQFDPPWNGRERGQPISEEAERETIDEFSKNSEEDLNITDFSSEVILKNSNGIEKFEIRLGDAYYKQGIINPGVRASEHLGKEGEPLEIRFGDGAEPIISRIDRTANSSGAVRVVGRNRQIAQWLQRNFEQGEIVEAQICNPNSILLLPKLR